MADDGYFYKIYLQKNNESSLRNYDRQEKKMIEMTVNFMLAHHLNGGLA